MRNWMPLAVVCTTVFAFASGPAADFAGSVNGLRRCLAPAMQSLDPARIRFLEEILRAVEGERKSPSAAAVTVPAPGVPPVAGGQAEEYLFFLKPEAVGRGGVDEAFKLLYDMGLPLQVTGARVYSGRAMRERGIVAQHYAAINRVARLGAGALSDAAKAAFGQKFGVPVEQARVYGALSLPAGGPYTAAQITAFWNDGLTRNNKPLEHGTTKLVPGTYALQLPDGSYILNGFHLSQLGQYTGSDALVVVAFSVRTVVGPQTVARLREAYGEERELSLLDFIRDRIIGATNPADAKPGSIRRTMLDRWTELGLDAKPDMQKNGCHFSAGPVEAMRELFVWFGRDVEETETGRFLVASGLPAALLRRLRDDPPSVTAGSRQMPLFDATEGMDRETLLGFLANSPEISALLEASAALDCDTAA